MIHQIFDKDGVLAYEASDRKPEREPPVCSSPGSVMDEHGAWMQYLCGFPFYIYDCKCHACRWVRINFVAHGDGANAWIGAPAARTDAFAASVARPDRVAKCNKRQSVAACDHAPLSPNAKVSSGDAPQ